MQQESVMPRYYIDVRTRFGVDEDLRGIDLPDLAAARLEALKVARALEDRWSAVPREARSHIAFHVVDEMQRTLLTIPCSELEAWASSGPAEWHI
jgi:hypothetical protein